MKVEKSMKVENSILKGRKEKPKQLLPELDQDTGALVIAPLRATWGVAWSLLFELFLFINK